MARSVERPLSTSVSTEREILPKNLRPIHYDIVVEPHLVEAVDFHCTVAIDLDVVEETSSITLNAIDIEILQTEIITGDGKPIEVSGLQFDKVKERVTVELKGKLAAEQRIQLKQTVKGSLLHNASAFFRSPIVRPNGKVDWMVSTQLEATDARRIFPCFDEPALKATFTVTLIADKSLTCLSNMDVAAEKNVGKGKRAVRMNKTPRMSTYILAFAIGDLKMIETKSFRVPVRVYASADKNIEHGRFGLELAARTLNAFEKIFGIDFPLPKMDLIAIPGGQGAMENWGLVTFGDSYLLVDEKDSSAEAFRTAGSVIVHELAHQWFGNLVTMEFWDGLWLNESFADWAELYAWETLNPEWQMWHDYAVEGYQRALVLDSNKASHPIEVPVNKATEVAQIFDTISYDKGCAVIRMISRHLGVELFVKGVQTYLKRAAYGNSYTSDLWDALSEASGEDVGKVMEAWTRFVGYPMMYVTEDEATGSITVTQHRFLQDGTHDPKDDKVLYPLKLRIRTEEGVDDKTELYDRTRTIKVPTNFFKLNADHPGFYRVLYEPKRLQKLGQNAKDGLLSPEDKIGLVSDAFAMAGSGHSNISTVLSLLEVFDEETNFFVWKQVLGVIDMISGAMGFEELPIKEGLKAFRKRLASKCLSKKGWDFKDSDDNMEKMFKALMFSNSGEDPRVREAANEMFQAFLAGNHRAININIQNAVFAIVLEHGGVKEYEAVLSASKTATSIDKRDICLGALGHASQHALIRRTLEYAVSPDILAINETSRVLNGLTKHAAGKQALWKWLKNDMDNIKRKVFGGSGRFARLVQLCTMSLCTREQWEDVKGFFEGKDTEEYGVYLAQALDHILATAKWVERDREDVKQWLRKNGYSPTN